MRYIYTAIVAFSILFGASSALPAECKTYFTNGSPDKAHVYHLSVTSASGSPVRITGSAALMGPDRFVQIDAETPYELTTCGVNILLIVSALDTEDRVDFSLSIDGQVSTTGEDNTVYAVGEDMPKRGSSFSANYQVEDDN